MKHKIEIKKTEKGVSIWVNGTWVLDASLFNEDMEFVMCSDRMKEKKAPYPKHRLFKFDRRRR